MLAQLHVKMYAQTYQYSGSTLANTSLIRLECVNRYQKQTLNAVLEIIFNPI